jgi:hypothetical protein
MHPNRVVASLAPVCALAAGAAATWLAEHFPGLDVPASALEEIFIAGALAVLAPALQWVYGWQQHEKREAEAELSLEKAEAGVSDVTVKVDTEETDDYFDDAGLDSEDFDLGSDDLDADLDFGSDEELDAILAEADGGDLETERTTG